jgi:hypothetical protein
MDWKNNKRIQVAVGGAVLFLALRWLFSPTLQDAALAYSTPDPAEGEVANPVTGLALLWPVIELGIALLAGVGLWVLNVGEWVWNQIQGSTTASAPAVKVSSPDKVQRDLIQAIATNDVAARAKLEPMVRGPEAISELTAAVAESDFATAETKLAELKKLAAQSEKSEVAK